MAVDKGLLRDLSPKAVKRSVLRAAAQHPLTVYPAAMAALGGAFGLAVEASPIALLALGIGVSVSAGSWFWEYVVRGSDHANDFVQQFQAQLQARREQAIEALQQDLTELGHDQALKQLSLFSEKYDNFVEILDRKLTPGELTYNRYLSIAEQVFLGGLDNLESAAVALRSISAIDIAHIQSELSGLVGDEDVLVVSRREELKKRAALVDTQQSHANRLFLENEKAMTHLDQVTTRIATINTQQKRAEVSLEEAMDELRRLIARADKYSQ